MIKVTVGNEPSASASANGGGGKGLGCCIAGQATRQDGLLTTATLY